jgi:hypothetical protein
MTLVLCEPFTADDIRMLIAWRQYFDAIYLSDITDAAGTQLLKTVWDGNLPLRTVDRPTRARPPPRRNLDLALWRRALGPLIVSSRNWELRSPLGLWLSAPPRGWRFHYSPSAEDRLYADSGHVWKSYRRTSRRINQRLNHGTFQLYQTLSPSVPPDLCRADIRRNKKSVTMLAFGRHNPLISPPRPSISGRGYHGDPSVTPMDCGHSFSLQ